MTVFSTDTEPTPQAAGSEPTGPATAEPARRRPRSGLSSLLPAVVLALLAVLLVVSGWLAWQLREDSRTDAARTEALAAARDAGRLLFSYDHQTLEEDFRAGLDVATGDFREEYERTTREVVQPVAEQYDAVVEAEVAEAAVVSASPDEVVTIVFVNQTTTSTRVDGPKIDQSRIRMVLRPVDGRWLVQEVRAL